MRYEYDSIDRICKSTISQAQSLKSEIGSIIDRARYEGVDTWFENNLTDVERSLDDLINNIYLIARRSK